MYLEVINKVIQYIEDNYNKQLSIKELESISYYSYRNIQRIFKYSCSETIGAYQKRIRLEKAYKLILYTKEPFSNIATEVGFETIASFSKAFKIQFGYNPTDARNNKAILFEKIKPTTQEKEKLKAEINYIPAIKVFYKSKLTYYNTEEIESLWIAIMENDFSKTSSKYFGLIQDEPLITDQIYCRYDACITEMPKNLELPSKTIFGKRYAKFIHKGSYDSIEDTYNRIYTGWILDTKIEFDHSPIIENYLFHEDNTDSEQNYLTEILIPIK